LYRPKRPPLDHHDGYNSFLWEQNLAEAEVAVSLQLKWKSNINIAHNTSPLLQSDVSV
jgi:hypothetical protein